MADTLTLKPAVPGTRIPMPGGYGLPHGTPLPAEGWPVPRDAFVDRLIADGDAVVVLAGASAAKANSPTPSTGNGSSS